MTKMVKIEIEVPEEVANALRDEGRRASALRLMSTLLTPGTSEVDPLTSLLAVIRAEAAAAGATDEMIDEELAAYNAERRS